MLSTLYACLSILFLSLCSPLHFTLSFCLYCSLLGSTDYVNIVLITDLYILLVCVLLETFVMNTKSCYSISRLLIVAFVTCSRISLSNLLQLLRSPLTYSLIPLPVQPAYCPQQSITKQLKHFR